jgi:hypothetical protein
MLDRPQVLAVELAQLSEGGWVHLRIDCADEAIILYDFAALALLGVQDADESHRHQAPRKARRGQQHEHIERIAVLRPGPRAAEFAGAVAGCAIP